MHLARDEHRAGERAHVTRPGFATGGLLGHGGSREAGLGAASTPGRRPARRSALAVRRGTARTGRTHGFAVPKSEIVENGYDLSLKRYQEIVQDEVRYEPPEVIINRLKKLQAEITEDIHDLEAMLG